jgi:hypothetical protein
MIIPLFEDAYDRCTNYTLSAFGIDITTPIRGFPQIKRLLRDNGYSIGGYEVYLDYIDQPIKLFIDDHPKGMYLLGTSKHAMALIDGVLIDSANGTNRRKLELAYQVIKGDESGLEKSTPRTIRI